MTNAQIVWLARPVHLVHYSALGAVALGGVFTCIWYLLTYSALGAVALGGKLYICGGYDGVSSLNSVEMYDPPSNRWTMIAGMEKHRSAGGIAVLDGQVYAMGGHDGLSIFDSVCLSCVYLCVYLFILCLSDVIQSVYHCVCLPVCLVSIFVFICLSCVFVSLSIFCLSLCFVSYANLCVYLSILCVSLCFSVYLCLCLSNLYLFISV